MRELEAAGDAEAAAAVARARKPNQAAGLVNALVRDRRAEVRDLLAAADAIRSARGRDDLRLAMERERAALAELTERLRELATDAGAGEPVVEAARRTLQAAAADPDTAEEVLAGHLEREREPTGFGGAAGAAPKPGRGREKPASAPASAGKKSAGAGKKSAAARKKSAAAGKKSSDAPASARTKSSGSSASASKESARERRARREAERGLAAARRRAEAAERELSQALERAERARRAVAAAEAKLEGA